MRFSMKKCKRKDLELADDRYLVVYRNVWLGKVWMVCKGQPVFLANYAAGRRVAAKHELMGITVRLSSVPVVRS